ncbi:hypothetical protein CFII64_22835 [Pseudomonas sp. CFII64]|nr:hypothetical protein CFII64_22835 [Pseudomonas sp. CFII64]
MFDLSLLIGLPKPNSILHRLPLKMPPLNYGRLALFGLMARRVFFFIVRKTLSWR